MSACAIQPESGYVDRTAVARVVAERAHMGILREAERREVVRVMTLRGDTTPVIAARREPGCTYATAVRRVQRWRTELRTAGLLPPVADSDDEAVLHPAEITRSE